jgi:signal transduction histidine kinase
VPFFCHNNGINLFAKLFLSDGVKSTAGNGDNEVRLSVRDHGTGIRTEVHERLFDRFFTTREKGLGMDWQLCAPS